MLIGPDCVNLNPNGFSLVRGTPSSDGCARFCRLLGESFQGFHFRFRVAGARELHGDPPQRGSSGAAVISIGT